MSALSDLIKSTLSMRAVAERYGYEPNRGGYIACPFHSERTPSLKIYDQPGRGFHCYGCHAGGSVIDFVIGLFDLDYPQAVIKLASDFGLTADNRPRPPDPVKRREAVEAAQRAAEYDSATVEHRRLFKALSGTPFNPAWAEAVRNIDNLEFWLDERRAGRDG